MEFTNRVNRKKGEFIYAADPQKGYTTGIFSMFKKEIPLLLFPFLEPNNVNTNLVK